MIAIYHLSLHGYHHHRRSLLDHCQLQLLLRRERTPTILFIRLILRGTETEAHEAHQVTFGMSLELQVLDGGCIKVIEEGSISSHDSVNLLASITASLVGALLRFGHHRWMVPVTC